MNKNSSTKILNIKYTLLQMSYWSVFCVLASYVSVYLTAHNYSAGQIGTLMAITNIAGTLLQPIIASFADRSRKISLKHIVSAIAALGLVTCLILCFPNLSFLIIGFTFIVAIVCHLLIQPLTSSIGMYFINQGKEINFGVARGMGSLAYTLVSSLIGIFIKNFGVIVIPIAAILYFALIILIMQTMQILPQGCVAEKVNKKANEESSSDSYLDLLRENPSFAILLIGVIFAFVYHSMANTYIYQIMLNVNGDSQTMGIALSIAAILEIPVMFGFSKIVKYIPVSKILLISSIGWFLKATGYFLSGSVLLIYLSQLLQIISYGIFVPASVYYANQIMSEGNKIKGQTMFTVAITLGGIVGNLIMGWIYDFMGIRAMLGAGVVFTFVAVLLFFFALRNNK